MERFFSIKYDFSRYRNQLIEHIMHFRRLCREETKLTGFLPFGKFLLPDAMRPAQCARRKCFVCHTSRSYRIKLVICIINWVVFDFIDGILKVRGDK